MIYNFFSTLSDAKEAQHYDHLFQKSLELAIASGVSVDIVRELDLHIQDEEGNFPLDVYIAENNIVVEFPEIYERAKSIWKKTTAWAIIYAYEGGFVYRRDHSDRKYDEVDLQISDLISIDENGTPIPKFIFESSENG